MMSNGDKRMRATTCEDPLAGLAVLAERIDRQRCPGPAWVEPPVRGFRKHLAACAAVAAVIAVAACAWVAARRSQVPPAVEPVLIVEAPVVPAAPAAVATVAAVVNPAPQWEIPADLSGPPSCSIRVETLRTTGPTNVRVAPGGFAWSMPRVSLP